MTDPDWNRETAPFVGSAIGGTWRRYCDLLHADLLSEWLPGPMDGRVLKTDLFDEACGDGLAPALSRVAQHIHGIDVATDVVDAAAGRHPLISASVDDVRSMKFADATFQLVVSNSTLDHFGSVSEIDISLGEIHRVTAPGGLLVLTLDNIANPVIAARSILPKGLLRATGLVPYHVGKSLGPRGTVKHVTSAGFDVVEVRSFMHVPRVFAVRGCARLDATSDDSVIMSVLRRMIRWERLGRWPTRWMTAHYVAVLAVKR